MADWTNFSHLSYQDRVTASPYKSNAEAAAKLTKVANNPLAYANDIQKIYYIQVNPAALQKPYRVTIKDWGGMFLRYGTAAGIWGKLKCFQIFRVLLLICC